MSLILKDIYVEGYEKIVEVIDSSCGLHAFVGIHDTTLGPALGGIRFYPYDNPAQALTDVKRLSRGMTHKAAVAEVGLGGGKCVVIADPEKKTIKMLDSLCKTFNLLDGAYISAADYGCKPEDIQYIKNKTKYVVGGIYEKGSGDPSIMTAWGVIVGMKASAKFLFGSDSLENKTVAIQGLGSVGMKIAEHLFWLGAKLIVADISVEKAEEAKARFGAAIVPIDQVLTVKADFVCPCALGGILNERSISQLNCEAIVGCANNQLLLESDALLLKQRNILYAPDFVVNAGGLINVSFEIDRDGYNPRSAKLKTDKIFKTLLEIYESAESLGLTTHQAAHAIIEYRLKNTIGKRTQSLFLVDPINELLEV